MAGAIPLNQTGYEYLDARPSSFYRELFVRGMNLRASRLVAWMEAEDLTPDQAAVDRGLPVAAVLEAIAYCQNHAEVIDDDLRREQELLRHRGMILPEAP